MARRMFGAMSLCRRIVHWIFWNKFQQFQNQNVFILSRLYYVKDTNVIL